jgi:protein phosphatase
MPARHEGLSGVSAPIEMAGVTDTGRVRPENEDHIATSPPLGVAVLADGMGGHQAGEVASRMAVDLTLQHFLDIFSRSTHKPATGKPGKTTLETRTVGDAIEIANTTIHAMARENTEYAGMGSTVVITVFHDDKVCIGHVGDSRCYRFRQGKLEQLTHDHSVVEELVARGLMSRDEARVTVGKNLVTRALGVDPFVAADISEHTLQDQDIYLLCSDGLNDVLPDEEIERILAGGLANLDETAHLLVAVANERGGPDNISVILVRSGSQFLREVEDIRRLRHAGKTR